ncbi:unnamed protein product [Candida verbasci]|uniref:BZIP domain-containing protein n=1 Tax=Candida verbasci TaxID=1227364 RepID=A0A9W4X9I0_9ASCO|nr:unnamed protein product [Candida verbasci]
MSTKGPTIAPRSAPSPIAIAGGSPPSSGSTPRCMASPHNPQSPPDTAVTTATALSTPKNVTTIMTSKEWVLPPRPKPGRKPSVDTPASKRKAQNRAAQRAFRERRATRVQELEQKLMEVEKEKDIKEMALVNTINKLKLENQFLQKGLEQLRMEMSQLKQQNAQKTNSTNNSTGPTINKSQSRNSVNNNQPSPINHNSISPAGSSYSLQQISPAPSADSPQNSFASYRPPSSNTLTPISNNTTPGKVNNITAQDAANFDCGVCLKDNCLCESVGLKEPSKPDDNEILDLSTFKPQPAVSLNKKRKRKLKVINEEDDQEIDFTKKFSTKTKPMPDLKKLKSVDNKQQHSANNDIFNEDSPMENCGFCSDDTPCVCREAAKEAARINESLNKEMIHDQQHNDSFDDDNKTLPPIIQFNSNNNQINERKSSLPVMHPGPSVEIREITNLSNTVPVTEEPSTEDNSGCTGNPGTCRQCQMDPMSTLFCTTVASKSVQIEVSPMRQSLSRTNSKVSLPINSLNNPQSPVPPPLLATNSSNNVNNQQQQQQPSTPNTNGGPSTPSNNQSAKDSNGIFIPCADAYKTLSRHKQFNSVDFSTLVGKLTTRGMQVEVQSVANVLRELDRKIYN